MKYSMAVVSRLHIYIEYVNVGIIDMKRYLFPVMSLIILGLFFGRVFIK